MNRQIPPAVFYIAIALVFLIAIVVLYRQATDPLYHVSPEEQTFTSPGERRREMEQIPPGLLPKSLRGQSGGQKTPAPQSKPPAEQSPSVR